MRDQSRRVLMASVAAHEDVRMWTPEILTKLVPSTNRRAFPRKATMVHLLLAVRRLSLAMAASGPRSS